MQTQAHNFISSYLLSKIYKISVDQLELKFKDHMKVEGLYQKTILVNYNIILCVSSFRVCNIIFNSILFAYVCVCVWGGARPE